VSWDHLVRGSVTLIRKRRGVGTLWHGTAVWWR
jgi:hypothetical protein